MKSSIGNTIDLSNGLVAHYKMNGDSNDNFGTNNGTDINVTYVDGKINQASNFDGSATINIDTPFNSGTTYSICFWFNPAIISQVYECIIGQNENLGLFFITNNAWGSACNYQLSFYYGADRGHSAVLTPNIWQHIIFEVENGTGIYYVNGSSTGSSNATDLSEWIITKIGNDYIGESLYGKLDEFRIYNRKLTTVEKFALINGGRGTEKLVSDTLNSLSSINAINHIHAIGTLPKVNSTLTGNSFNAIATDNHNIHSTMERI